MVKVVSVEQMAAIEKAIDEGGISYDQMMANAGRGLASVIARLLGDDTADLRVAFIIGPGNNGGDGLTAATILKQHTEAEIGCYLLRKRNAEKDEVYAAAVEAGVFMANPEDDTGWRVLRFLVSNADVVVDSLFGTGIRLPLDNDARRMLTITQAEMLAKALETPLTWPTDPAMPAKPVRALLVAADCPSGIDCNTGDADPKTLEADITVCFEAVKRGLLLGKAQSLVGEIIVSGIGAPDKLPIRDEIMLNLITPGTVRAVLPERHSDAHKGTYGKALCVAGSQRYVGAASLAGQAAYRSGAGLVVLAVPHTIQAMLAPTNREAVWLPLGEKAGALDGANAAEQVLTHLDGISAMLVGPGLGTEHQTVAFMQQILAHSELPALVIDADGLNLLTHVDDWVQQLPDNTILTPHPGEMRRLTGEESEMDRLNLATNYAAEWNAIVVLKGAFTVCAAPDGRVDVSPFAVDALATAGTGDVLAGVITGLLGQGLDPFDAAVAGVYVHALAGKLVASHINSQSVLASDVLNELPQAFQLLLN